MRGDNTSLGLRVMENAGLPLASLETRQPLALRVAIAALRWSPVDRLAKDINLGSTSVEKARASRTKAVTSIASSIG